MGASMVCFCAAADGTAGVTSSADEVTPAAPAGSGGGGGARRWRRRAAAARGGGGGPEAGCGGGRQHKRPRAGCRKRRVARDWRVSTLQLQKYELVEDTRDSPSPGRIAPFRLGSAAEYHATTESCTDLFHVDIPNVV
jgi:hypothetical protein